MITAARLTSIHQGRRRRVCFCLLALGAALAVGACTAEPGRPTTTQDSATTDAGVAPGSPASESASVGAEESPSAEPSGDGEQSPDSDTASTDTAALADSVDGALQQLAGEQDRVTSAQVRAAIERGFMDAGVVAEAVEVSIDLTPTGLDVDAIQGSGLIGGECIVGEIREGIVSMAVLPVLATGQCFVGDQR